MDNFVRQLLAGIPAEYNQALMVLVPVTGALVLGVLLLRWVKRRQRTARNFRSRRQANDLRIREQTYSDAEHEIEKNILPALTKKSGGIVIEMIHDTDFDAYFREAAPHHISFDEAFEIIRRIEAAPKANIYLVLHTLGGYSMPSIMIADAIRQHRKGGGRVTAFVPRVAMSGGTIAALASDCVYMGNLARLGPIDTMYAGFSGQALRELDERKTTDRQEDENILLSIEAAKYDLFYLNELKRLLDTHELDEKIYDGSLSHSNLFNRDDAESYGIRVVPRKSALAGKSERKTTQLSETLKDHAKLATQLVDARLRMIKNHEKRDEEKEAASKAA
jgi:ATP-dependent protease ClpP protease subunit